MKIFLTLLAAAVLVAGIVNVSAGATNVVAKAKKPTPVKNPSPPIFVVPTVTNTSEVFYYRQVATNRYGNGSGEVKPFPPGQIEWTTPAAVSPPAAANFSPPMAQPQSAVQQPLLYYQPSGYYGGYSQEWTVPAGPGGVRSAGYYYQPSGYYGGYSQEWTVPVATAGVGFNYQRVAARSDRSGGFWSFLGLGGIAEATIVSRPVVHEVRIYQGPSVNARFEAGGHSGGSERRGHR